MAFTSHQLDQGHTMWIPIAAVTLYVASSLRIFDVFLQDGCSLKSRRLDPFVQLASSFDVYHRSGTAKVNLSLCRETALTVILHTLGR